MSIGPQSEKSPSSPAKIAKNQEQPFFTDPKERKRIADRTVEMVGDMHEKGYKNLIFLDKSARPLATLFRETWLRLYPEEDIPQSIFMNIGQEVTRNDGIVLMNLAIKKVVADQKGFDRWEKMALKEPEAMEGATQQVIDQLRSVAGSDDETAKTETAYRLGTTMDPILFGQLLNALSDEEVTKNLSFIDIDQAIKTYMPALKRMRDTGTCIIDEYEHTGRSRVFAEWFVKYLIGHAFPAEEPTGKVDSMAFSSLNKPVFNQRNVGDFGPPWQKMELDIGDWDTLSRRPLQSRSRWSKKQEIPEELKEIDADPEMGEELKTFLKKRLLLERDELTVQQKNVTKLRNELKQIISTEVEPARSNIQPSTEAATRSSWAKKILSIFGK